MTIAGSSLSAFLLARTTYFLISNNAPEAAFDALGVPRELRRDDSPEGWALIGRWADPTLPGGDHTLDGDVLDAQGIRELLGSRG